MYAMYCLFTIAKEMISKERNFYLFLAVCDKNHMWCEVCVACNIFFVLVIRVDILCHCYYLLLVKKKCYNISVCWLSIYAYCL